MITAKEGRRGPKDDGMNELAYLGKVLGEFEFLSLEFMVNECERVFDLFDFDKETYPELYSALNGAKKAELDFHLNIKKNMKKTKKTALGEQHIEDVFSLNPHKVKEGEYDARIIDYFSEMIKTVQKEAMAQYASGLKEKWLNIARHRAEKGHISRDVDEALSMASQYANMSNTPLDTPTHEMIQNLHKKSMEDYANTNMKKITSYASRILKQRTSEERYEKLMHYAKKLSDESGIKIFQSNAALFPILTEYPGIEKLINIPGHEPAFSGEVKDKK
jgi:hypothetical protein